VPYLETKGDNNQAADANHRAAGGHRPVMLVIMMGFVLAASAVSSVAFLSTSVHCSS
jgi:hypothetical protein